MIPSTRSTAKPIIWILRIFPAFSYGYGLICIANRELYAIIDGYFEPKSPYSFDLAGGDMYFIVFKKKNFFLKVISWNHSNNLLFISYTNRKIVNNLIILTCDEIVKIYIIQNKFKFF